MAQRVPRLVALDTEISENYRRLYSQAINILFKRAGKTDKEIVDGLTAPVKDALLKVLPDLELKSLENPSGNTGSFYFAKGAVSRYAYENLSGGERSVFDLLLDMAIKRNMYPDAIHCIDEPETHLGMGVQGNLLEAMFNFIPKQSQLWIGTHSIGILRKASQLAHERTGEVVFLNFHDKNFDKPQVIEPIERPNRAFWRKMHNIALDDLANLIAPSTIIICESDKGFDATCYNTIFSSTHPDVQFASVGGKGVLKRVCLALERADIGVNLLTLRDRDQMTSKEEEDYKADKGLVLSRRCIEKYLLDDEVLSKFCEKYTILGRMSDFQEKRDNEENLKAQPNKIHGLAVSLLKDSNIGDNPTSFMTDTLAPLITPETEVYCKLHEDIFGGIPKTIPDPPTA